VAFAPSTNFSGVYVEGIRHVSALDIAFADELGYRIKLLGVARLTEHGLEQRVHPCMVPRSTPIAHVDGVFNAVVVEGDFVGRVMLEGRGAGAEPTASAVVADLLDIARERWSSSFTVPAASLEARPASPMLRHVGAYYVRLMVVDRPGVIADIAAALRDEQVSMEQMIQRGRAPGEAVPVVLTTHETEEAAMRRALARISALKTVLEPPRMIRVDNL
jgi:homoserine dehydrogenase